MRVGKYTLWDALAFLAITGSKRGLGVDTRIAMYDYTEWEAAIGTDYVTAEGMELAAQSRMWKAHLHMLSLGFNWASDRVQVPKKNFLSYRHDLADRTGFISKGRVYASPTDGGWRTELVATFRNGRG